MSCRFIRIVFTGAKDTHRQHHLFPSLQSYQMLHCLYMPINLLPVMWTGVAATDNLDNGQEKRTAARREHAWKISHMKRSTQSRYHVLYPCS